MRISFSFIAGLGLLAVGLTTPAAAQQLNNDGFQRRNGQMHVIRNGQLRPMERDARLPTGAVVTKDGFVVSREGRRTELREGQGCDLKGNPVAVVSAAGGLALGASAAPRGAAAGPAAEQVRAVLENFLGGHYEEYDKKGRGRGKKGKQKWKKGKDWDD